MNQPSQRVLDHQLDEHFGRAHVTNTANIRKLNHCPLTVQMKEALTTPDSEFNNSFLHPSSPPITDIYENQYGVIAHFLKDMDSQRPGSPAFFMRPGIKHSVLPMNYMAKPDIPYRDLLLLERAENLSYLKFFSSEAPYNPSMTNVLIPKLCPEGVEFKGILQITDKNSRSFIDVLGFEAITGSFGPLGAERHLHSQFVYMVHEGDSTAYLLPRSHTRGAATIVLGLAGSISSTLRLLHIPQWIFKN